jgi:hypothetical protein
MWHTEQKLVIQDRQLSEHGPTCTGAVLSLQVIVNEQELLMLPQASYWSMVYVAVPLHDVPLVIWIGNIDAAQTTACIRIETETTYSEHKTFQPDHQLANQ